MCRLHHPAAEGHRSDDDLGGLEPVDRQQGAENVDLGIDGSDLVEVNLFRGRAVHVSFCPGQTLVNLGRLLANRLGNLRMVESADQIGQMAMGRGLFKGFDGGLAADNPASGLWREVEPVFWQRSGEGVDQDGLRYSQVDQRGQ